VLPRPRTWRATRRTAFNLAHYVATEKRYYEAENLKVGAVVVGAALRGAPIRILAGAASNAPFRLVAAKTIKGWSDLRHNAELRRY
jgi:hypothetical protein